MEHSFSINCSAIFSCCFLLKRDLLLGFESRLHFGRPVSSNEVSMKSLLGSAPHHSLQWQLWSFCEPPNWLYGHCAKCLLTLSIISSQRPAFFFLTLLSKSTINKHTEIWKWTDSASVSHLIQETVAICYLSLWEIKWLVQSLRKPSV